MTGPEWERLYQACSQFGTVLRHAFLDDGWIIILGWLIALLNFLTYALVWEWN